MKSARSWGMPILLLSTTLTVMAKGSGVGIYARIDQIAFDQGDSLSKMVRISGVFVIPAPMSSGGYQAPRRGYLYFQIAPGREEVRNELEQLKKFAGTGQVVGFAYGASGRHSGDHGASRGDSRACAIDEIRGGRLQGPLSIII